MKVVITGGKGWIGEKVVAHLEEQGIDVVAFDLKNGRNIFNKPQLDAVLSNADAVIHMAAIPHNDPKKKWEEFEKLNVEGTRAVLESAREANVRFVMFSSGAIYGFDGGFKDPEVRPVPLDWIGDPGAINNYARSKIAAEQLVHQFDAEQFNKADRSPSIILRVNWPGGCPDQSLLERHLGAEVAWEKLLQIVQKSLEVELPAGVYTFNAVNETLRDGNPAHLEVKNRLDTLGV